MNKNITQLVFFIFLFFLSFQINAQVAMSASNSGEIFYGCDGVYTDDGGESLYSAIYDPNNDDVPDFLCWTFCPSHPINEGVRLAFSHWDIGDTDNNPIDADDDFFRIRNGKDGLCSHVPASGLSPLVGGGTGFAFTGSSPSQFDGSAGGTYAAGGGAWIQADPLTNPSGCLTVEFRPDGDGNKGTGWKFTVECIQDEVQPSDLFISEYSNDCNGNMYVELYNPTNETIKLEDDFTLRRQLGTDFGTGNYEFDLLNGEIPPNSSYVIYKQGASNKIKANGDLQVNLFGSNGSRFADVNCNEAIGLFQSGYIIDQVGNATTATGNKVAGFNNATSNYTLIRKKTITNGNVDWDKSGGTNESNSEWLLVPQDRCKNIGTHIIGDQGIFISEFYGHEYSKAYVEIYNNTGSAIDLENVDIILAEGSQDWASYAPAGTPEYSGGWTTGTVRILELQGTLNRGETYVIANQSASPAIACQADLLLDLSANPGQSALRLAGGNDALGLFLNHVLIDVVGVPGSNEIYRVNNIWNATDRNILERKGPIGKSNCDWAASSDRWGEWDVLPNDDFSHVGARRGANNPCYSQVFVSKYLNDQEMVAVGLVNKSPTAVDLNNFILKMSSNGQDWDANPITFPAGTMLSTNEEFVVYQSVGNSFASVPNRKKMQTNQFVDAAGKHIGMDDAIGVFQQEDGLLLDVLGDQNKQNGGLGYKIAGVNNALAYNFIQRKAATEFGNTTPMASHGNRRSDSEWILINKNTTEGFGTIATDDRIPTLTYEMSINATASCESAGNAAVQFLLNGGTGPFTMTVGSITGSTDGVVEGLSSGTYTLVVVDAYGVRHSNQIEIEVPVVESAGINASVAAIIAPSCSGATDGAATVTTDGSAVNYVWEDGKTTATNTQLGAGLHTVIVRNAAGCEKILSFVIEDTPALSSRTDLVAALSCNGAADASARMMVEGGTGTYRYAWSNNQLSATATDLGAGTYTVTATDASGCSLVNTIEIISPAALTATANLETPSCATSTLGKITLAVSGGAAPYQYSWNGNAYTSQSILDQAVGGTYMVLIKDANGCELVENYTLEEAGSLEATIENTKAVSCGSAANGEAAVSSSQTGLSYLWSDGTTSFSNEKLAAGLHTVTITNAQGCSRVLNVEIATTSSMEVSSRVEQPTCDNTSTGSISLDITGGTAPYQYSWNGSAYSSQSTLDQAVGGTYMVLIKDANGCELVENYTLEEAGSLEATIENTNAVSCGVAANGRAAVISSQTGLSYLWSDGTTSASNEQLAAGLYMVTVTNAQGCSRVLSVDIGTAISMDLISTVEQPTCGNISAGSISLDITGGTGPYEYNWNGGGYIVGQAALNNIVGGQYTVNIRDANGCELAENFNLDAPEAINATIANVQGISCNGAADGRAEVITSQSDLSIRWSDGSTEAINNQLAVGSHRVKISNAQGCEKALIVVIVGRPALSATTNLVTAIDCGGTATASASILAEGGTGNYTYLWNNNQTGATATDLVAGIYTVTATDNNGCAVVNSLEIAESSPVQVTITSKQPTCNEPASGQINLAASGGLAPYEYNWNNSGYEADYTVLEAAGAGTYTIGVRDANGCEHTQQFTLIAPSNFEVVIDNIAAPSCAETADGTARLSTTASGINYLWEDGTTSATNTQLAAGTHQVTVANAQSCGKVVEVFIPTISPIGLGVAVTASDRCNTAKGRAVVIVTGGEGEYTYKWDNEETTATAIELLAGTHTVTVTDAKGCAATTTVEVSNIDQSEMENIEISLCEGASYTTAQEIYTKAGNYMETYLLEDGCNKIVSIAVSVATLPTLDLGPDRIIKADEVFQIELPAIYASYQWSTGGQTRFLEIAAADLPSDRNEITLTVTNEAGCIAVDTIMVSVVQQLTATIDPAILRNIHFSPNPSTGLVYVVDENKIAVPTQIEVFTPQGQLVKSWKFDHLQTAQLDLTGLSNSLYLIKIIREEKVGFEKILLSK